MTSFLARQAFGSLRRVSRTSFARPIHSTAPVLKKKKPAADHDDLFADDLFNVEPTPKPTTTTKSASPSTEATPASRGLETEERAELFKQWIAHVEQRVGRKPEIDHALRKTIFNILLELATTREQVETVVDLIPKFIARKRQLPSSFAEAFARRCQELQCPDLALKVFGSFPVYNASMDLPAARWLLHSLYLKHPFTDVLLVANLFPAYGLAPVHTDLVSASLLAASCYKHKTPESLQIAEALQPHISKMLEKVDLSQAPNANAAREQKWAAWALRRVNLRRGAEAGPFVDMGKLPLKVKLPSYKPPVKPKAVQTKGKQPTGKKAQKA